MHVIRWVIILRRVVDKKHSALFASKDSPKKCPRCSQLVSFCTIMRGLMPQVQYREILEKYGWQVSPHSPYSPDMSPTDFDLFPKLKKPLCGKRFRSIEEVYNEVTRVIRRINKEGVLTGIQYLPKRWTALIKHNGGYIEGL